jgi:phenylpropionate dioxygenase-like ring-hydroxylating dioxygenase large terminal subunit
MEQADVAILRAMFQGFARVWTPVALSHELKRAPFAVKVADTPVVLFRGVDEKPAALLDRCPHRGVALSLGQMKDGCIECPFHGWQLKPSGEVCHVPWNPDAKLGNLRGHSLPVRELGGLVWLYTDFTEAPPSEPEMSEHALAKGVHLSGSRVTWKTHWTRAMENMLDWPHLPFVHAGSIGKSMIARKKTGRMDVTWEDRPWGAHTKIRIDGEEQRGSLDLRWPNQMNLHIPIPNKLMMMMVACIPETPSTTTMLLLMARDFMTSSLFDPIFHRSNAKIAEEDRAIVESSFPMEVPPAGEEKSVRTDAPTLAFRKRYYAELRETSSTPKV